MLRELKGKDTEDIEEWVDERLQRNERIMGFGHRVYETMDPRANELREIAKKLDISEGNDWVSLSDRLAEIVYRKRICPNVDFYAASVYANLEIPDDQFINMFVMGRIVGWITHMIDQYQNNRIVRPLQKYVGEEKRAFIQIDKR